MAHPHDERVRVRVPAKVNLSLRVAARGSDGFHRLATVFQALDLFDELCAEPRHDGRITVQTSGDQAHLVGDDASNLAVKAAVALREQFGQPALGVDLVIDKHIPVAGGMAGGSADAAAALLACSVMWDLDTGPDELAALGAQLGSDVPFALMGGTALGLGRGSDVMPALTRGNYHWALALSDEGLSTPAVYNCFDEQLASGRRQAWDPEDLDAPVPLLNALANGDPGEVAKLLVNDLQAAACELRPDLAATLASGLAAGALGALVSGSGPTCAFLCASGPEARVVEHAVGELAQVSRALYVTSPAPGAQLITAD